MDLTAIPLRSSSTPGRYSAAEKPLLTFAKPAMVAALALILAACGGGDTVSTPDGSSDAVVQRFGTRTVRNLNPQSDVATESQVIDSFNNLSLQLLREQAESESGANTVNSGYSLAIALSMLQRGTANDDFNVIQQLLGVSAIEDAALYPAINAIDLQLESRSNDGLELKSANQLFVRPGFALETDFMDVMTSEFNAPISEARFQQAPQEVRQAINEWASENTNDLIPELLTQPLPADTALAVLNATLLDAKWRQTFTDATNHQFTNLDGGVQAVAAFTGTNNFQFLETDDALSVSIQYQGSEISLMMIVPNDIETYIASLTAEEILQRHTDSRSSFLNLTVPNWTIKSSIDFTELAMTSSLIGRAIDMTRMTPSANCCEIGSFMQQAVIEVDKDGTRAAAITSITGVDTSAVRIPELVDIDQPFLYFIRDEPTGLILFSGQVLSL